MKYRSWNEEYWSRLKPPQWKMENIIVEALPHTFEHIPAPLPGWRAKTLWGVIYCIAAGVVVAFGLGMWL